MAQMQFPSSTHLPLPLNALIGREHEVATLVALVRGAEIRLLTLTGPGGVGKTRLALTTSAAVADDFPDGVTFVALAAISDPSLVASTIGQVLGVRELGESSLLDSLKAYLRDKRHLLVLDNFEQVVEAAPLVIDLLLECPNLTVLVTSRMRLRVSGEREIPVPPLALPDKESEVAADRLAKSAAIRLFVTRAEAVKPGFRLTDDNATAVAAICRRLDGLPLAIELAATRVKMLPPSALLDRLEQRLPLLTRGGRDVAVRQQTMRDTIAWSYDLLPAEEQALFSRLAVFVGGFTLEAAEWVAGSQGFNVTGNTTPRHPDTLTPQVPDTSVLDGIAALMDSSLLQPTLWPDGVTECDVPRYAMLETVREFGLDRLEACGETQSAHAAHAAYFLAFAEAQTPGPLTSVDADWLKRLDADHDNLRAAFDWLSAQEMSEACLRLAVACAPYWGLREHRWEGRARLDRALALAGPEPTVLRGRALHFACAAALVTRDLEAAASLAHEGLAVANSVGDLRDRAVALQFAGWAEEIAWRLDAAAEFYHAALAAWREVGDPVDVARVLVGLVGVTFGRGDLTRARALTEEAAAIFRDAGHSDWVAATEWYLGLIAASERRLVEGARHYADALHLAVAVDDAHLQAQVLVALAAIAVEVAPTDVAARLLGAADAQLERSGGELFPFAQSLVARAEDGIGAALGDAGLAARAAGRALNQDDVRAGADSVIAAAAEAERTRLRRGAGLTPREREILELLADGKTDREIAETLFVSRRTINSHVASILGQLGVHTRQDAVIQARQRRLLPNKPDASRYT
jgi:predicted ATPase/DNA-binding CsgD family transcriptional regulator